MTTNEVTAVKISTPCIRKCKLINDHCVGCGRTWQQIRDWTFYKESERLAIMNMSAGKGDKPRNCFSKQYKDNHDLIDWGRKKNKKNKKGSNSER